MSNSYFQFQKFRIEQEHSGMKVTTDACLFGAWVSRLLKRSVEPKRVLDVGTGTGLLALMLAQATKESQINALEINQAAFEEAQRNFQNATWSGRVHALHHRLQDHRPNEKYNLILSNPPFFKSSQKSLVSDRNQAIHAHSLSMQDLLDGVVSLLDEKGSFYGMYPTYEMDSFAVLAGRFGLFPNRSVSVRHTQQSPVFRELVQFQFEATETATSELIIKKDHNRYTDEFWQLLKDYYLPRNDPAFTASTN